jgi:hypothetical protein
LERAGNHDIATHGQRVLRSSNAVASSNVEHVVNTRTVGEGLNGHIPLWIASVVDRWASPELLGTL